MNENLKINYAKQMSSTKHITSFRLERVPRQIQKNTEKPPLAKNVWKRIPLYSNGVEPRRKISREKHRTLNTVKHRLLQMRLV